MKPRSSNKSTLSQQEIDEIVAAQADDDSAWGKPTKVTRRSTTSVPIPADLAARAAFLARVHHTSSVEEWLSRVIEERVELEEAAFAKAKRSMKRSTG